MIFKWVKVKVWKFFLNMFQFILVTSGVGDSSLAGGLAFVCESSASVDEEDDLRLILMTSASIF